MKKLLVIFLTSTTIYSQNNNSDINLPVIMAINKLTGLNIGKKSKVDIKLYAKNPSTICSLRIKSISKLHSTFKNIRLKPGHYILKDINNIIKGNYELEYTWYKNNKFIDSYIKDIHIYEYHNTKHKIYKKLTITKNIKINNRCN